MASAPAHETPSIPLFLHGLDSSILGTKAQWFQRHFPRVRLQNYTGDLAERLAQLEAQVAGLDRLMLVGSSFGGLMAACFALRSPERCRRLVLLAPALNFADFHPPKLEPTRMSRSSPATCSSNWASRSSRSPA